MIVEFNDIFVGTDSCVNEIVDKHKFILEDDTLMKGVFVNANELHHIHIENKILENYFFVQNDDCVMKSISGGQCDYVIFNSKNIHFVEVKATNQNLKTHKQKLYKQLENTFKFYKDFLEKFEMKFALVCFEHKNQNGYTKRKVPQSSLSEKKVLFKTNYNVDLFEGNYISFE